MGSISTGLNMKNVTNVPGRRKGSESTLDVHGLGCGFVAARPATNDDDDNDR